MEEQLGSVDQADASLARVVGLQRQIEALTAERAEALVDFQRDFDAAYPASARPMLPRARRAELACALTIPERTAERLLGEAGLLVHRLPSTLQAVKDGRASFRHALVLAEATTTLSDQDTTAIETAVLERAGRLTVSKFKRAVLTLRERRHPESMIERCAEAYRERAVTFDPAADGMAYLTLYLGAVEAQAIYNRLTECAESIVREGDDPRTLAQIRADLMADVLLDRASGEAGRFTGIRPTIIATVPALTLAGKSDEPGMLEGVGPIDPATARELTAEAPSLYRLLTHPFSGIALALDRTSYRIPRGLRTWLRIRDGSCIFFGCSISTKRSDVDHTHDWQRLGRSNDDNLAHLSRGHHTLKHSGGWTLEQLSPGRFRWTSFLGRSYEVTGEGIDLAPPGSTFDWLKFGEDLSRRDAPAA